VLAPGQHALLTADVFAAGILEGEAETIVSASSESRALKRKREGHGRNDGVRRHRCPETASTPALGLFAWGLNGARNKLDRSGCPRARPFSRASDLYAPRFLVYCDCIHVLDVLYYCMRSLLLAEEFGWRIRRVLLDGGQSVEPQFLLQFLAAERRNVLVHTTRSRVSDLCFSVLGAGRLTGLYPRCKTARAILDPRRPPRAQQATLLYPQAVPRRSA
jgi:hypothetical protein